MSKSDLDFWKSRASKLKEECTKKQKEIDKLSKDNSSYRNANIYYQKQLEDCEQKNKSLCQQRDELQRKILELESRLQFKEDLLKLKIKEYDERPGYNYDLGGGKAIRFSGFQRSESDPLFDIIFNHIKKRNCGNRLQKENEKLKTIINQIDDVLKELFGVTFEICETPEELAEFKECLEKVIKTKGFSDFLPAEPICVADMLIGAKRSYECNAMQKALTGMDIAYYHIFDVSELRQIAEHLLIYCNYQKGNENE